MADKIELQDEGGHQCLLATWGNPDGEFRVRIVTEETLQAMHDGDFALYRKRVARLRRHAEGNPTRMTDPKTIRAYDYLRHAVKRETERRKI